MSISHAQLKAFHAVAIHGGFSRAAIRMNLTQPAISDQVRKLEEAFGVLLFHRNKRIVRLSELGEQLLDVTRRLFSVQAEAEELLSVYRSFTGGNLVLSVDSTVHILSHLSRFRGLYPDVTFKLVTGNAKQSLGRVLDRQADMAVVGGWEGDDIGKDPKLVSVFLGRAPLIAFVAQEHPWSSRDSVSLSDLAETSIVMRERGSCTREIFEMEMQRVHLTIGGAIEVEGREAANELVAQGIGVGIVSQAEFSNDRRLCALPIADGQLHMTESLVCLREQAFHKIIRAFMSLAR